MIAAALMIFPNRKRAKEMGKMNKFKKIAASVFAVICLFNSLSVSAELSELQKSCPDFNEIEDMSFDSMVFDETVKKITRIAETKDHKRSAEVKRHLKILIEQYMHMQTVTNIESINYYSDVTNSEFSQNYLDIQKLNNDMYDDLSQCCLDLYNAGFNDELSDVKGYDLTEIFLVDRDDDISDEEYEKNLAENNKYINEINDITNEYYSYTEEDFIVEYKNQTWILSDILNNSSISYSDYEAIAKLIHDKRNNILGEMYLELIHKRNEIAKLYGYENYAEYAYDKFYIKDYSIEDTDEIYTYIKEYFSEIQKNISDKALFSAMGSELYNMDFSGNKALNIADSFFKQLDPEIYENFEHMRSRHLYDISMSPSKSGDSFMTSLYDYEVPFLFISPNGDYYDLLNLIHEFGHANAEYINPSSGIYDEKGTSIDTSEMHSQGMEVLFTNYSEQILGEENGRAFNQIIISNLIDSVLQGCLFDEFQKYAYTHPDCTVEDLNAEYKSLCVEYGIEYSDSDPYIYDWVELPHNYTSPMYYISYATSAVPVLDLWIKSMNDMSGAVELYKKIADCNMYTPYIETAEKCGLATLFDKEALKEIAYQTEYYFENDTIDKNYKRSDTDISQEKTDDSSMPLPEPDVEKPTESSRRAFENNISVAESKDNYNRCYELMKIIALVVSITLLAVFVVYLISFFIAVAAVINHSRHRKRKD